MSIDPIAVSPLVGVVIDRVHNVKVHKRRCRHLVQRCETLILALTEDDAPPAHANALNEATSILGTIRNRVGNWANMTPMRSLLEQEKIREELEEYNKKVDTCIAKCHVEISRQMAQAQEDHWVAAQRDIQELREMIRELGEELRSHNAASRAITQDLREEYIAAIPEENGCSQSALQDDDVLERAMGFLNRSLVNLKLTLPGDTNVQPTPPTGSPTFPPSLFRQERRGTLPRIKLPRWHSTPESMRPLTTESTRPLLSPSSFRGEETDWDGHQSACSSTAFHGSNSAGSGTSRCDTIAVHGPGFERRHSEPQSPLEITLTTRENVRNSAGNPPVITQATMEGLIQYLLRNYTDKEQRDVFFISHLAVISHLRVLRMLIRQYTEAVRFSVEECNDIQTRVLRLIRDWLKNEYVMIDNEVLEEITDFITTVSYSSYTNEIRGRIQQKASINRPLPPVISPPTALALQSNPSPRLLAAALATMAQDKYRHILPIEYIGHVCKLPLYCPNLSATISLNQLIKIWVQSCILKKELGEWKDGLAKRSKCKKFFVETAMECQMIGNFSSVGAITSALQSGVIGRLTLTHDKMPSKAQSQYRELEKFIYPEADYDGYRKALSKRKHHISIPWHVVTLHGIKASMECNSLVDDRHDPPLLNIQMLAHLKDGVMLPMSLAHWYHTPFDSSNMGYAMEYLVRELHGVDPGQDFTKRLRAWSNELVKQEYHMDKPEGRVRRAIERRPSA